jgi:hypothetical protein
MLLLADAHPQPAAAASSQQQLLAAASSWCNCLQQQQ